MKKNKKSYIFTILFVIILRVADLTLTYLYTPNLINEYNPLISIIGASWTGLIFFQVILIILISFVGYFYFFLPRNTIPSSEFSFKQFGEYYFEGNDKSKKQRFFLVPKNFTTHIIFNGFLFLSVTIFVSLFAILNNSALLLDVQWYNIFLSENYHILFPAVFGMIIIVSAVLFFYKEYDDYVKGKMLQKQK